MKQSPSGRETISAKQPKKGVEKISRKSCWRGNGKRAGKKTVLGEVSSKILRNEA